MRRQHFQFVSVALLAFGGAVFSAADAAENAGVVAIKAGRVLTMAGDPINGAVIVVRDGKIEAVGAGIAIPDGAKVIDVPDAVITPGLIDACCIIDSQLWQNNFYFRNRFSCPDCAELSRRHLKARNGGTDLSAAPELCPACRANTNGGEKFWAKLGAEAVERAQEAADGTVSLNAAEHEGHSHGPGDVCAGVCGGPKSAAYDAAPFASVAVSPRISWAEHGSEVVPHTRMMDSTNLLSSDFDRLLQSGVTTVYVSPESASVIGARGSIVRTGGDLSKRVVRSADAVKASVGSDPSFRGRSNMLPAGGYADLHTRRPTTRMGVDFVFRKAFYDTQRWSAGLATKGADTAPVDAFPVLKQVLDGKIPLRIQARMQHDIVTAMRLAHEFGLKFTLEEGTEAARCIPELKATGTPVIFGPLFTTAQGIRDFVNEADRPILATPRILQDAGIPFAITAQEMRDEESLIRQAMIATRFGLPAEAALSAVTTNAAKLIGLGEGAGTIKAGGEADLVVWSGDPLSATSRVKAVVIGGTVVYER